ncbi:hypothetical protein [methanotrophic endosymbiont of Bathymodiolus puteoserpentis (Logatchev)]|jgi:uncharacterized low-complexity protein|uniref:hypothetical protein n=1 Tax=methanotrophic endosymbiont of Bathymodiolus puteoserpentis (Logatchev) TaxID=343235 RepID=UPI0013CD7E92|nr:hypothetical protein [methanotrophic endosymbiont of Bathymodiolus puteoserpentis (Logatchev)]SHE21601.1 FIG024746: hypothetical protein [methanotrophic endosymbiont of Bathymodiolus puteoserpentis (Logatchev)]
MKMINKTKFAIGTSLVAGLVTGCTTSDTNLFGQEELSSGYMNQADSAKEEAVTKVKDGACGEGKCGGKMMSDKEKVKEGTCGDKKMVTDVEKAVEGKCGENK